METTEFDKWMAGWPDGTPPKHELVALAKNLCSGTGGKQSFPISSGDTTPTTSNGNLVSWNGVSVEWFQECFVKSPEVLRLRDFGCRMWFVRGYCITEMLRRRGVTSGSVIDHLDKFGSINFVSTGATQTSSVHSSDWGKASAFVSYTGFYTLEHFAELVQHRDLRGRFMWMDTLCVDQFAWTEHDTDEMRLFKQGFMGKLKQQIASIGYTTLMLERWNELMLSLGKIWVLWEIFSTVDGGADLRILLRPKESERFMEDLGEPEGLVGIRESLSRIDVRKATAWDPDDQVLILTKIDENDGVFLVNSQVLKRMRQWLTETAQESFDSKKASGVFVGGLRLNLAYLYDDLGHYADAEQLCREEVDANRKELGDRDPDTLASINNLAVVLDKRGAEAEAEQLYLESLRGRLAVLGEDHHETLRSLQTRAMRLAKRGKFLEAESIYQKVLFGFKLTLGDQDPSTLSCMSNMAILLKRQGRLPASERLHVEVLASRRQHQGNYHPETLNTISQLASVRRVMGKMASAEALAREALRGRLIQLGDTHPETLNSRGTLATILWYSGALDEAEALHRAVLEERRVQFGESHELTLESYNNLACVLKDQGNLLEAEALYRKVLSTNLKAVGESHPSTLASMNNLGSVLYEQDVFDEAEELLRKALACRREQLGSQHPETLSTLNNLACLLSDSDNEVEAEPLYREALEGYKATLGDMHLETLATTLNVGLFMEDRGKVAEALDFVKQSWIGFVEILGSSHTHSQQARIALDRLHELLGTETET